MGTVQGLTIVLYTYIYHNFFLNKKLDFGCIKTNHFTNQKFNLLWKNFFDCSYAAIQFKRLFSGLPDYGAGMKFNLNEMVPSTLGWYPGHRYGDIQFWSSFDGNGNEQADLDFSVRRARVLLYAQINKDFLILTHIGLNSLNSNTMSPTGTGEGSQVFYMMLGLNTVL
jgi:hypothetical protein